MTRDEVVAHIGTIAKSGTGELKRRLQEDKASATNIADLIGQFGVGFYSAFMVADKVKLVTRRAGSSKPSNGSRKEPAPIPSAMPKRPTRHLHHPLPAATRPRQRHRRLHRRLAHLLHRPQTLRLHRLSQSSSKKTNEDQTLNSMKPIWKRSPSEITKEEYTEFYKHVSHDWNDPLKTIHFRAEGTFEYEALLYIPSKAPWDLYYMGSETGGLRLFARRVMIMEKCEDLLPRYLRFINGVVDASDLPLNISRQRLQQDAHITRMRKRLTTKVLDTIKDINEKEPEQYLTLWTEFGRAIQGRRRRRLR